MAQSTPSPPPAPLSAGPPDANARAQQPRKFPRYEIAAYVDCAGSEVMLRYRLQNISLGGLCIQCEQVEEVGTEVLMTELEIDEAKANEAKKMAEEAMRNAKSDIDLAAAQSEFAAMAAQLAAIAKLRKK